MKAKILRFYSFFSINNSIQHSIISIHTKSDVSTSYPNNVRKIFILSPSTLRSCKWPLLSRFRTKIMYTIHFSCLLYVLYVKRQEHIERKESVRIEKEIKFSLCWQRRTLGNKMMKLEHCWVQRSVVFYFISFLSPRPHPTVPTLNWRWENFGLDMGRYWESVQRRKLDLNRAFDRLQNERWSRLSQYTEISSP